jgi:hypothetical protein
MVMKCSLDHVFDHNISEKCNCYTFQHPSLFLLLSVIIVDTVVVVDLIRGRSKSSIVESI